MFNPDSAHSVVVEALEKKSSSEALAKRIWMSFVVEGRDSLYQEDIAEVLGPDRQAEAEECFAGLDRDGNGDISLDEMILTVTEFGRERKSIASSMHDVDQAINVLDRLLCTVVFVICIFVLGEFFSACSNDLNTDVNHSRFPQRQFCHNSRHRWHSSSVSLVCLRGDCAGSPRILHLPLRQTPVRHWRQSRHQWRALDRRAHFSIVHGLQASHERQDPSDSEYRTQWSMD